LETPQHQKQSHLFEFEELLEQVSEGIIVVNQEGHIVFVNSAAARIFKYDKATLSQKNLQVLIPDRYKGTHEQHQQHFFHKPHQRTMGSGLDLKGKCSDGTEFPLEVSLSPYQTNSGKYVLAFIQDITARKLYEAAIIQQKEDLEKLNAALEQSSTLSSLLEKERQLNELKNRFVSMASHEFRTPLTGILSSAALIPRYVDKGETEQVKKHSILIKNAVENLNNIISNFLSLGKIEQGAIAVQIQKTDPEAFFKEIIELFDFNLKNEQSISYTLNSNGPVGFDPLILKNILINLIGNASKYSPEGAPIRLEGNFTTNPARISIIDQGIGIPEEDQENLFRLFYRATNVSNIKGTGLGLFIVKRYLDLMNGRISFKSEQGKGSVFTIEFSVEA
jgi:PAS domain S-box-containing protein